MRPSHPLLLASLAALAAAALPAQAQVAAPVSSPLLVQTAQAAAKAPPPFTLDYAVKGKMKGISYSANSTLQWAPSASGQYRIAVKTSMFPLGTRTQTSEGRVGSRGLEPSRMTDDWRGVKSTRFVRSGGGSIQFAAADRAAQPLLPGAQDQASLAVQAAALVSANPSAYVPGKRLAIQVAGLNSAPVWQVVVDKPQTITVAGNNYNAIHLRQIPQAGQQKTTELWLVPWTAGGHASYLPARIRVSEAGGAFIDEIAKALP